MATSYRWRGPSGTPVVLDGSKDQGIAPDYGD